MCRAQRPTPARQQMLWPTMRTHPWFLSCPYSDYLCSRAGWPREQQTIKASGSREGLRAEHSGSRYELQLGGDAGWVRDEPGVSIVNFDGGYALFDTDTAETAQRILRTAVATGTVLSFAPQHPSLSQIFKEVIR